ncbi:MAG: hypothetical protein LBO70_08005 [Clostridiales Family XIII bacterium]|nr:hypothetical protein [Clostridiales Family XIII bacterium]
MDGAVLSQTIATGREPDVDAEKYGISPGKAALIRKLVQSDTRFRFEDLAGLPINDINLLIEGRRDAVQGISSSGKAAAGEYIGEGKAPKKNKEEQQGQEYHEKASLEHCAEERGRNPFAGIRRGSREGLRMG